MADRSRIVFGGGHGALRLPVHGSENAIYDALIERGLKLSPEETSRLPPPRFE